MREELDKKLVEKYPYIFRDRYGDMHTTSMCWGFACGDGWFDLIDNLCGEIMKADPGKHVCADQVKEKFGGLRFYFHDTFPDHECSERIQRLVGEAEEKSFHICEICGAQQSAMCNRGGWLKTLCGECARETGYKERRESGKDKETSKE